jgi:DNA-binding GntR family transcriptional regulator
LFAIDFEYKRMKSADPASPTAAPILHRAASARLRRLIVEGRIAPGQKLNERALAEQLELVPHRGAVAAQLSADDVAHTFEVIAGLEGQSGQLAAERIGEHELDEIRALQFEMLAAHARRDLPTYYRLNATIHDHINAAARNPVLTQTYRTVNARLQALRFRSNFDQAKWDRAVREHERMIELLQARDGNALRKLLVAHLEHKRDAVLELMKA